MKQQENTSEQIQSLLEYIAILTETRDSFINQYKELSKSFISIKYREKTFLDKIFFKRYENFLNNYETSKKKEHEMIELDDNILQLQIEIEQSEAFLYSLQKQFCDEYHAISFIEKSTPNLENIELV